LINIKSQHFIGMFENITCELYCITFVHLDYYGAKYNYLQSLSWCSVKQN